MSVLIRARADSYKLPEEYGGQVLGEGNVVIINDTLPNVSTLLGLSARRSVELKLVPNSQPGEITPAPSPAHRAGSYVPNPSANWAATAPSTVGDAMDRMATKVKALNAGTAIP